MLKRPKSHQKEKLKKKILVFIDFWLCWVLVVALGLSLVAASRGYSLVAVIRLLFAVASLVAGYGL